MKNTKLLLVGPAMIFVVFVSGCESASKKLIDRERTKTEIVQQPMTSTWARYPVDSLNYKIETELKIERNQQRIDELKDIMVNLGPIAIKRYRKDMHALQRSNLDLALTLEVVRSEAQAEPD